MLLELLRATKRREMRRKAPSTTPMVPFVEKFLMEKLENRDVFSSWSTTLVYCYLFCSVKVMWFCVLLDFEVGVFYDYLHGANTYSSQT